MRNLTLLGASALVLALGAAVASAEPFDPVTGYNGSTYGHAYRYGTTPTNEGRAAATDNWASSSSVLEQFHEGK